MSHFSHIKVTNLLLFTIKGVYNEGIYETQKKHDWDYYRWNKMRKLEFTEGTRTFWIGNEDYKSLLRGNFHTFSLKNDWYFVEAVVHVWDKSQAQHESMRWIFESYEAVQIENRKQRLSRSDCERNNEFIARNCKCSSCNFEVRCWERCKSRN